MSGVLDLPGSLEQATALLAETALNEVASAHLFAALGEVPLRVSDAVAAGTLDVAEATETAGVALRAQGVLRDQVQKAHADAFARVQAVLAELCHGSSAAELLAGAPAALCLAGGFDRAVISRVEDGHWVPRVLHTAGTGSPDLAHLLTGLRIPLKVGLVEADVVLGRASQVVEHAELDPRTYRPLVDRGGIGSYVVAPIVVGGRVVGILHADRTHDDVPTSLDRDLAKLFAETFGRAYERAVLSERVDKQRERLRLAFSGEPQTTDPAEVRFTLQPAVFVEAKATEGLSLREQEVLALLATGATNQQIAAELVVSESTVKWHVKRILRKLNAANRAEAAYLHLRSS